MNEGSGLIARFYREVIGDGDLSLVDELTAEDFVDHEEGLPGQPAGKEGVKFFVNAMREAFPDIAPVEVSPLLADADLEAARVVLRGTHSGELMGVAPTEKTVEIESIDIIRVVDGRVAEHWGVTDTAGLMTQIGALPQPA